MAVFQRLEPQAVHVSKLWKLFRCAFPNPGTFSPAGSTPWQTGWITGIAIALAATVAEARVFRLFGGSLSADPPGWRTLYRAELEINGGRAELTVTGVSLPPAEALAVWRAAVEREGGEAAVAMGERFGWGVAMLGDRVWRALVIATEGPREGVLFRLEQSRADFERAQRGAAPVTDSEPFGGARTVRIVRDLTHRTQARTLESPAGPTETAEAIERALTAEGWIPALPGARSAGVYLRGGELCVVRVTASEAPGGGSRVLWVQRRLEH